jgi:dihydroorotate dehydrogenase
MINRLGFNNEGHASALERLGRRKHRGVVGVNIGANKDSADRIADYVAGLEALAAVADYFTVNISSPNTPGLRDLQAPEALDRLLGRLMAKRDELAGAGVPSRPIAVKLSPDLLGDDVAPVCERLVAHGVDGIIVSNTTLERPSLKAGGPASEAGGLSGAPLYERSTRLLAKVYVLTRGEIPLIGVGGINSGETALGKLQAGASLLQLYTGLVYEGPGLVGRIKKSLLAAIEHAGAQSIDELIGTKCREWC